MCYETGLYNIKNLNGESLLNKKILELCNKKKLPKNQSQMLTNRYLNGIPADSRIMTDGRFLKQSAVTPECLEQIRKLNEIAKERGQTLAEMALAWVLKDGIVTSVLIGASKPSQILDNIKAINNTDFSSDELKKIDEISI